MVSHQEETNDILVTITWSDHTHYEPEWKFWLGFWLGGNTTHIHDFCIPLDFLGTKDLQKNKKGLDKATATLIEILLFFLYLDRFDLRIQPFLIFLEVLGT